MTAPREFKARQHAIIKTEDGLVHHYVVDDNRRIAIHIPWNMFDLLKLEILKIDKDRSQTGEVKFE